MFIKYPEFNRIQKRNDIGLIRLAVAADTSRNNIGTICLPTVEIYDIERVFRPNSRGQPPLVISGFSYFNENKRTNVLHVAPVPFVTNAECVKEYKDAPHITIRKEYLCSGGQIKVGICQGNSKFIYFLFLITSFPLKGDSGGPVFAFVAKNKAMLYGVAIGGVDCARHDLIFPDISDDIRYYLKWILDSIDTFNPTTTKPTINNIWSN